ncbi:MAG: DUF2752 domain-containing protein [Planctomycetaceae bacterium]|nr:DUF2752 domain-containing protein [Planctomycetaceae bacterium]
MNDVTQPAGLTRPGARCVAGESRHWQMLVISIGVLLLSFQLHVVSEDRVALRILPRLLLPETCFTKSVFSTECPGCGLTRSFIYLAEGNLQQSLQMNRFGWVMAIAVLLQIPYRISSLCMGRRAVPLWLCRWFGYLLIAGLVINWSINQYTMVKHQ